MSSDWEKLIKPHPYDEGRFQAARLFGRPSSVLRHTLELATRNRARIATRVFKPRERHFLEGFIDAIRGEIDRRAETGEEPPDSTTETAAEVLETFEERRRELRPERLPSRSPVNLRTPDWVLRPATDSKPVPDLPITSGPVWAGPDPLFVDEPSASPSEDSSPALRSPPGEGHLPIPPPALNSTDLDTLFASPSGDELVRPQPRDRERERERPPLTENLWTGPEFLFTGVPEETRMGRPLSPLPAGGETRNPGWTGPEFLFTGVPDRLEEDPHPGIPRPTSPERLGGPEFLFRGVPEDLAARHPRASHDRPAPPPGEAGGGDQGLDPGLLVAPEEPPPSLRERIANAWRALIARLEYTPPQDWDS